jgi:hypothetical protein
MSAARSAVLLGLASLVLPGAGQLLGARPGRAAFLLLLAAALWWFLLAGHLVHLWAALDAALTRSAHDARSARD